ncbi:MAG: cupin domain-containing protein [Marinilabiliaceae bacterium]|nr:cupin domain-containing protein [Marinilabiliaceae bacterium]
MLNVLIVYAVKEELIELSMPNCRFNYCCTGVGKVSAALAAEKSIVMFKPDIVLNIGTAGSVNFPVGTIHLCRKYIDRDMEKLHKFGVPYQEDFTAEIEALPFFKGWNFDSICNTGDSFLTKADGTGDIFDMESFAVARVCRKHKIPFVGIKYVTDIIGQNSVKHWEEKLAEAQAGLQMFMDAHTLNVPGNYINERARKLIDSYQLIRHVEGGWYREMFRSDILVSSDELCNKSALTSIYFLLVNRDKSVFHRIKSPEIWYFHEGMPIIIHEISFDGSYNKVELSNSDEGVLQHTVKEGTWFAADLKDSYGYGFVSCAVAPGFDFEDFEIASTETLLNDFPQHKTVIHRLT